MIQGAEKKLLKSVLNDPTAKEKMLIAIESLPERQSTVIKMQLGIESKEKTNQEIAEELNLSKGYISSLASRARYRLMRTKYLWKMS